MYRGRLHRFEANPTDLCREVGSFTHSRGEQLETMAPMAHVRQSPLRPTEVLAEAWAGDMDLETRPLSAGGVFSSPHIDSLRRVHRPGSAVGLRNEVGMSRLQAQLADLQSKLGAANVEVQRLQELRDQAEAEAQLQRSLVATQKAQVAQLQQQLASRVEIQALEEKLNNAEESRASLEKESEEERRQLSEKVALFESRALELEAELKRQRLAQDDTRALADHRFRETEERCKNLQSLMDDVTRSASAEMDAAAERVREFQADLESWQLWAEEEKERRNELESKVTSKDLEVQHLLQQLHLANSDVEALHRSMAELKSDEELRSQQYERKLLQYKSRVEAELQEASGRESELEIKLKARNQECDRLGQESLKTKDLQEKVAALQAKLEESQRQRSTAAVKADLETAERRACELERRIASTQEEHEHQLTLQRTTKARLEAATAKAQDFELQCQTLTLKLEKLQARSEENDLKFDRQLALHREEVCSAFSRVQELERQMNRQKVEEERLEQDLGTKTREVEDLHVELLKGQEQERKRSELAMECEDLKGQLLTSKQELEKEKTLSSDLQKKCEESQAQLEASKKTFEEQLQSSKQEFDSQREHLEAQLQASKQASEELEQESTRFSELDTQREKLEVELQASKQAVEELEKEKGRCSELEVQQQHLQAQLQNSEQELVEERTRSIELDRRCGELEAQLLSSKQAFEEQTDAMEEARAHVEGLSKSLKESREKCDALWLRKQDLELKLSEVQNSAAEQITFFQEQLRASKDAAQAQDESFREKLADLSEAKRQVAELQQMIKERDAEIENYEEILKQPTMDPMELQAPTDPLEGSLQLEPVRPKVTLHLDVAKTTLSPTSDSPGSPCAPGGLMRSKGLHQGVSVQHICGSFIEDVEATGSSPASPIYELEKLVAKWTASALCPLDGQLGAAYVHGLEGDQRCAATHLLSYSSATALQDMADSLKQHCNEVGTSTDKAFIWLKTLCWNLHRHEIPDQIKALTDERIRNIGHVLVLLTPWDEPDYFKRKWCTMEMELALSLSQESPEQVTTVTTVTMLTTLQELDRMGEAICTSSSVVPEVWQRCAALRLDHSITAHFRAWIATSAETWLRQRLAQGSGALGGASVACDTVGWLLREVSLHHRAAALLQDALQLALCGSDMEGSSSPVLCCLGTTMGCCCNQTELLQSCDSAIQAHQQKGTLETMAGMELLSSFGAAMWMSGDPEGAARALQQAVFIRVANRTLDNPQGAMLLRNFGVMKWAMGFHKESLELFEEAKRVRKCTGCFCGAHAAVLMMNMGYAKAELGDFQGSLEAFQEVLALLTVGSASSSMTFGSDTSFALPDPLDTMPCGATLISSIAVAKGNLGRYDDALRAYSRAQLIRKSTKTMCSPAGAVLMRNKGMAHFGRKEYADALSAYLAAKDIRQETGTLKTYAGANLLSNLASARAKTGDGIVAVEDCQSACDVHKQVGTLQTPGGQAALKQLKELKRCCPKATQTKEEAPQRRKASKDKTLKTPNRDKAK